MKRSFIFLAFLLTMSSFIAQSEAALYKVTNTMTDNTILTVYDRNGTGFVLRPQQSVIIDKSGNEPAVSEEININNITLEQLSIAERERLMGYIARDETESKKAMDDEKALEMQNAEQNTNPSAITNENDFSKSQTTENNVMSEKKESNGFTGFLIIVIIAFLIWRHLRSRNRNKCGSCGAINDSDAVICESCGKKLHEVVK